MSPWTRRLADAAMPDDDAQGWGAGARRLAVRTVVDSADDRVPGMAAEMAFYVVVSLPPLLLVVFGSMGYLVGGLPAQEVAQLEAGILGALETFLAPDTVAQVLEEPVRDLLSDGRGDVLSIGLVLTLWSASRSTNVLLRTVVRAYDIEEHRTAVRRRGLAIGITVGFVVSAVVVLPLLVVGPDVVARVLDAVGADPALARFWTIAYWPAVVVVGVAALAGIYHVALAARTPWRRDLPGAVLAFVGWVVASAGIRVYSAQFATFTADDTFRGLAAPLVLLLWVYATSVAVLVGAELNAEIAKLWPLDEPTTDTQPPHVVDEDAPVDDDDPEPADATPARHGASS